MNLQTFTLGRIRIRQLLLPLLIVLLGQLANADWKVDFSRRKELQPNEIPVEFKQEEEKSFFDGMFTKGPDTMDVVIINTETGFIPSQVRLLEGRNYKVHVVNVNAKDKNVSFVLDAFSEHHSTYYGAVKTFLISPQKEGIYSFESPETNSRGRIIVQSVGDTKPAVPDVVELPIRRPASTP